MSKETGLAPADAYETSGKVYREAALYVASFHAYVQLHGLALDGDPYTVELSKDRLDEEEQKVLR